MKQITVIPKLIKVKAFQFDFKKVSEMVPTDDIFSIEINDVDIFGSEKRFGKQLIFSVNTPLIVEVHDKDWILMGADSYPYICRDSVFKKTYDIIDVNDIMEKQKKYCKDRNLPFFATKEGRCYLCHRKLEDTDEYHITGCPHCNRSFCD